MTKTVCDKCRGEIKSATYVFSLKTHDGGPWVHLDLCRACAPAARDLMYQWSLPKGGLCPQNCGSVDSFPSPKHLSDCPLYKRDAL